MSRVVPPGVKIVWIGSGWDYTCDECGMSALCGVWANAEAAILQAQKHSLKAHWPRTWPITWRSTSGPGLPYPIIKLLTGEP